MIFLVFLLCVPLINATIYSYYGFFYFSVALFTSGQHKAALNIWENICLVKYRELLGTHPFTASLLDHIGKIYQALGKPRRAVSLKKESLRMRHLLLGMQG